MPIPFARSAWLLAAAAATFLAGCVAEMPSPPGNDRFMVEPIRLTHRVIFADGASEIGSAQQYELAAFLQDADPDRRADIYLDARGPDKDGRIDAVAATLDGLGRESAGAGGGDGIEHGVTVTLLQDVVLPEACLNGDDWPHPDLPPASCTHALTLVRMVEDQGDLLRGREMGPALSETAAQAAVRHLRRKHRPAAPPAPAYPAAPAAEAGTPAADEGAADPVLPPSPPTREASY